MDPVVIWPVAVSVWAGGTVATARQLYASKWRPDDEAVTRNGALGLSILWPIWVPLMYLGKTVCAGWRLAVRLVFGGMWAGNGR